MDPVDEMAGREGVNLSIAHLSPDTLEVVLEESESKKGKLGTQYAFKASIWSDGHDFRLLSGSIHTSCSKPIALDDVHEDFRISDLAFLDPANDERFDRDPHGPKEAPGLTAQREFLEDHRHRIDALVGNG